MHDLYAEERRRLLNLERRDRNRALLWIFLFGLLLAALIVVPQ